MDFMANMTACREYASTLHYALKDQGVDGLPEKNKHFAFRVPVGGGHQVSVSYPPDANPGGKVVETLVFGPDGQAIYDLPEEFEYDGDVRRFYEFDHVSKIAAHIKALREHFGYNAAGGAASPNQNSDQDSDKDSEQKDSGEDQEVSEEIINTRRLRELLRDIQELIGERLRAAQRHRAEIEMRAIERENNILKKIMQSQKLLAEKITEKIIPRLQRASEERDKDTKYLWTQLDALRGSRNRMTDEMRAMAEQMRAMKELLRTQQQQMSEMNQKIALLEAKTSK